MTTFGDAFYRDILEGLAVHADSAFYRDILATLTRHQEPALGIALNKNQMASKRWLAEALLDAVGGRLGQVMILGGWFGALAAVLLHDRRFDIERIDSVDIDPNCAPLALSLNATHVRAGRFAARTADMLDVDYAAERADLVVNTSCEHLADFARWYARIPDGQRLVLQSNDYVAVREHVNCVADLAAFKAQAPLSETYFAGERPMRHYVRFMLIGRK
ncbi:MAG: hypothetical protein ACM3JC_02000 [Rudaea sp.]